MSQTQSLLGFIRSTIQRIQRAIKTKQYRTRVEIYDITSDNPRQLLALMKQRDLSTSALPPLDKKWVVAGWLVDGLAWMYFSTGQLASKALRLILRRA